MLVYSPIQSSFYKANWEIKIPTKSNILFVEDDFFLSAIKKINVNHFRNGSTFIQTHSISTLTSPDV